LDLFVYTSTKKLCHPNRAKAGNIKEVAFEYLRNLHRLRLAQHRPESCCHVFDSAPIISHHVVEIVGVLIIAAGLKCESFQGDERAWSTNPDVPRRSLAKYGFATQMDSLAIEKSKPQPGNNESGKVWF
jgi:hypothetical protein